MRPGILHLTFAALLTAAACGASGAEVRVAVAANFEAPMRRIAASFEHATGNKVLATFGATGKFYAQISNGAPFEVLLAADEQTSARLAAEGNAVAASRFPYAIGKLVLWSPTPGYVDAHGDVLAGGTFRHLSLANPELAPYGAAAVATLKHLGLFDTLRPRFVTGENISQAHQFVATGAAELGFVALSQVLMDGTIDGSAWTVPADFYPPIRQDAVLLAKGKDNPAAAAFLAFLKSDAARSIICFFGYESADDPCEGFRWDVARERQLFAGDAQALPAGTDETSAPLLTTDRLYDLEVVPQDQVRFVVPPGRKVTPEHASAGLAHLRVGAAGDYRISIDQGSWVDVVAGHQLIPSRDFQGRPGCRAPHKIVLYALPADQDLTLQFSGATSSPLRAAITLARTAPAR